MRLYFWYKRKWVLFLIYFILGTMILYSIKYIIQEKKMVYCYNIKTVETLPDISDIEPRKGQSIFFHETSCRSYQKGKIVINSRQACAVESTARLHPDFDIYVLYSSPGIFKFEGDESDKFLQILLDYENVNILHVDHENYTKGTPVEALFSSGKLENSKYVVSHSSDVLRYLTLWKYGGIYMDLDVLVLKSLTDLIPNYAGQESEDTVASGVLGFEATGKGHVMLDWCLDYLRLHFNGQGWSDNGPGIITRLAKSLCSANTTHEMINKDCKGLNILSENHFFPVPWQRWKMYFEEQFVDAVANMTQDSIAIHAWNKLSHAKTIPLSSNASYLNFARKYCPKVVKACDEFF